MNIQELISGCAKSSRNAQNELYRLYSSVLYGICLRFSGNRDEAADVLQDSLVKIYKNIHKLNTTEEKVLVSWMKKITVNTALNFLRDNRKLKFALEIDETVMQINSDSNENDGLFSETELGIEVSDLLKFIQQLPVGYRTVFNMYAIDNLSHKEIAGQLEISVNTSKTQLFKARKMLMTMIKETINKDNIKLVV